MPALAWTAVGLTLVIAGLGLATLVTGLPEPAESTAAEPAAPADQAHADLAGAAGGDAAGPALATRAAALAAPAKVRMPWTVIAAHGVLATATIMLVLLAAIGA